MRETWYLKNIHTRELTIGDLDQAPTIQPGKTVDFLRYHTKQEIEQSDDLKSAIDSGYIKLIKKRDGVRIVKETVNDINLCLENAEIDDSVRYYGEMYGDEIASNVTLTDTVTFVQVDGSILGGSCNGVLFVAGGTLQIVIPGTYAIHWTLSAQTDSGGQELVGAIMLNGVKQAKGTNHSTTTAVDRGEALAGNAIFSRLVEGDSISLAVSNHTSVRDILIDHANLVIWRLGV